MDIRSGSGTRGPATIDKAVAEYWKEHYDLRHILETNWATLGPKVAHKINVYVGDADTYYLNMGVHMLNEFLMKTEDPKCTGEIVFQPMAPHCWGPRARICCAKMAAQITKSRRPAPIRRRGNTADRRRASA